MIIRVEVENSFGLQFAFLLDDGLEQLLLVPEIHIERTLGDAGGAGNVVHAGRIEALGQENGTGPFDDLTPLGAVFVERCR